MRTKTHNNNSSLRVSSNVCQEFKQNIYKTHRQYSVGIVLLELKFLRIYKDSFHTYSRRNGTSFTPKNP